MFARERERERDEREKERERERNEKKIEANIRQNWGERKSCIYLMDPLL